MQQTPGAAVVLEPIIERTADGAVDHLRAAQATMEADQQNGLVLLNDLFRSGRHLLHHWVAVTPVNSSSSILPRSLHG